MAEPIASIKLKPWNDPIWLMARDLSFVAGETWADHFQRAKNEVARRAALHETKPLIQALPSAPPATDIA